MLIRGKLRDDWTITFLLIPLSVAAVFGAITIFWGYPAGAGFLSLVFLIYAVLALQSQWRTGNPHYLIQFGYLLSFGLAIGAFGLWGRRAPASRALWMIGLFFAIWLFYVFLTGKIKWKGREVMELAALPVEESTGGFTGRPIPIGRVEASKDDLLGFAAFLMRHAVAWAVREPDRVLLYPVKMGREARYLYGWSGPDPDAASWVSFSFEGSVAAHLSKEDHLDYQEALAFDQLSANLGALFIEFFELYRRGEGVRILDRLHTVRRNPFV